MSPSATSSAAPQRAAGVVSTRGLARRFGETTAVAPLDLDVGPGGITGLLGPNGSGKTTLLRMLLGLVRPSAGAACVDGAALTGDGTAIRRRAAYMPGELVVYGPMSGREHLSWLLRGRPRAARARAVGLGEELGLPLRAPVRTYSHGMKRQLFFTAALAPDVRVRLLDEPTDGLDPSMRRQVLDLLRADAERGVTVLLSSHHLSEVEEVCARLVFLNRGQILSDELAERLRERSRSVLQLAWPPGADSAAFAERLTQLGAREVRPRAHRATVVLDGVDAAAFVGRLAESSVPPLAAAEFGRLSLSELYRDLYGVEGL